MEKFKNLANTFWQGALKVLEMMGVLAVLLIAFVVVLPVIYGLGLGGSLVIETCGFLGIILYAIDLVLVYLFIELLFKSHKFKGNAFTRIAKRIGAVVLFILALAFINVVLWAFGHCLLLIFGVKLAIGTTAIIGLIATVVVFLLWLLVEYIKTQGWTKTLEKIVYGLGMALVLAIVGLVIWFIVV